MSYCRFGDGDVYVILTTHPSSLECCGCILQEREWRDDDSAPFGGYFHSVGDIIETNFYTTADMINHLELHKNKGQIIVKQEDWEAPGTYL